MEIWKVNGLAWYKNLENKTKQSFAIRAPLGFILVFELTYNYSMLCR